jgi:hypothetical protein
MPELSRFFGIIIQMYSEPFAPHHRPHFHAYYQEMAAVFGLEPIEMISGSLPLRQQRFVEAWAEMHQEELLEDWRLLKRDAVQRRLRRSSNDAMKHAICRVKSFSIVGPYTLKVCFDDGASREIDFQPILHGELYGPLRDRHLFEQVNLDPEVHTLVWPNGADFDPATLRDWPSPPGEAARAAEHWRQQAESVAKTT